MSGASGCKIWVDGRECLDLHGGHGTLLWGNTAEHIQPSTAVAGGGLFIGQHSDATFDVVHLLRRHSGLHHVCFASTGSQCTALAVRMARRATGRATVVTFDGSWHGWAAELGQPAPGPDLTVLPAYTQFEPPRDCACIVVEPLNALRKRLCHPQWAEGQWLAYVQEQARACGALLILDETVTGFRFPRGGKARFGLQPDMVTYGKSLGGGLPLAALLVSEAAYTPTVQTAGTMVAHPLIMDAARSFLRSHASFDHARLARLTAQLVAALSSLPGLRTASEGSIFQVDAPDRPRDGNGRLPELELALLRRGVFVQTASFYFLSAPFDEAAVAEVARRWELAMADAWPDARPVGEERCKVK